MASLRSMILLVSLVVFASPAFAADDVFFPATELPAEMRQGFEAVIGKFLAAGKVKLSTQTVFGQSVDFVVPNDDAAAAAFYDEVSQNLRGQLPHVVDSFGGFKVTYEGKAYSLSQDILKRFTTDHHGPNFVDADYRTNTTMKLVDLLKSVGADKFKALLARVTTDNLADAVDGIFLRTYADQFAAHPELLDLFAQVGSYEDFGLFGTNPTESAKAQKISKAMLQLYDDALKEAKAFTGSDRINTLPPDTQKTMVRKLVQSLHDLWFDSNDNIGVREERVAELEAVFTREQAKAKAALAKSYDEFMAKADPGGRLGLKDRLIVVKDLPQTVDGPGRFASWSAVSQLNANAPANMTLTQLPNGKTLTIVSLIDGRGLDGDLGPLVNELNAGGVKIAARGRRLLFDFAGSSRSPEEILDLVKPTVLDDSSAKVIFGVKAVAVSPGCRNLGDKAQRFGMTPHL